MLMALANSSAEALGNESVTLPPIVVTAPAESNDTTEASLGSVLLLKEKLAATQGTSTDAAQLLLEIPGMSLQGAGGLSSLPMLHGLADDRLRIQVDGRDVVSACPNHMNAPLSYVPPSRVKKIQVFVGVSPVSVGGDNLGGTIRVHLAPPEFATVEQGHRFRAEAGSFYRSNGHAFGYHWMANVASRRLSLMYAQSSAQSENYRAGGNFKPVGAGREGGRLLAGNEVGSSGFHGATYRSLGLALHQEGHLVEVDISRQTVDFEGFPNQRMDLTGNDNWLAGLRYTGQFKWGDLQARAGYQYTRHGMDMGPDRNFYGTGMPMDSKARNRELGIRGTIFLNDNQRFRTGTEYQFYTLYDWWPAVGGVMGPNDFWNIDFGRRHRISGFGEWEGKLSPVWLGLVGIRVERVNSDAAAVQGYNNGLAGAWGNDATAFNTRNHIRYNHLWDGTLLFDYSPAAWQSYQAGYSRKSRSPNLYQRYTWSTNPMAALMNNFSGDGNGYVGNVDLDPEIAHSLSMTGRWQDPANERWDFKATSYVTYVQDYIDAERCNLGQCGEGNTDRSAGFVLLKYVNQSARLEGLDISGRFVLLKGRQKRRVEALATLVFGRGKNVSTQDHLYNLMPQSGRVVGIYRDGGWSLSSEVIAVGTKKRVSRVRNEIPTGSYWLCNVRGDLVWEFIRVDLAIENLFNQRYANPQGGAYLGQGPSMTTQGIPWGVVVPGRGRSMNLAFSITY